MGSIINLVYALIIAFLLVNIVVNSQIRESLKKFLNKKIGKSNFFIKDFFNGIAIVIVIFISQKFILKTIDNIKYINTSMESQEKILDESNSKAEITRRIYQNIINNSKVDLDSGKNPYIPEGFNYKEGTWDTGFVIEDEKQNQFVWIPVASVRNSEGLQVLEKHNFVTTPTVSYFYCYEDDESYSDFLKSALENGGYYISRYEIGNENGIAVSKPGVKIWNEISYEEAKEISENMYTSINSKLINGYAYDTAFNFVLEEIEEDCQNESTGLTGTKSYKNIYDIVDNMCEITSEMQYNSPVFRGYITNTGYDISEKLDNRLIIGLDYISEKLAFRTILYK